MKGQLRKLILQRWNIGFTETPLEDILAGKPIQYRWMKHNYENRWFADPFLLDVTNDAYIVLAEDFEDNRGYAVISKLVVDKQTLELKDVKQLLDRGTHLSFPVIMREGDDVFVYPENSESGEQNLYRYDQQHEQLVKVETLMQAPLTDAVMIEYGGEQLMFATTLPNPNGNKVNMYIKRDGKFELKDTILVQGRTARMGGDFFWVNGALYRPAQDNNECYGGALILQKVIVKDGKWSFEDMRRLTSPHPQYTTGLHTFNMYKGTVVVDIHGYRRHACLSHLLTKSINLFRTRR
jgi:hypothetical protein